MNVRPDKRGYYFRTFVLEYDSTRADMEELVRG